MKIALADQITMQDDLLNFAVEKATFAHLKEPLGAIKAELYREAFALLTDPRADRSDLRSPKFRFFILFFNLIL